MLRLYEVVSDDQGYHFSNNAGDNYDVYILGYDLYDANEQENDFVPIYSIGFNCLRQHPDQRYRFDNRTKNTIISIFKTFFDAHPNDAFIYICDNSDDRERARKITFGRWFREENNNDEYERHISHVQHMGSNWYSCLVLNQDNPNKDNIIKSYKYTIKLTLDQVDGN